MTDDKFFERLREDARQLQFPLDSMTMTRLGARIRARVTAPATVSQMLAGWLRPLAATVAAMALAAVVSITWIEQSQNSATIDQLAVNTTEIAVDGASLGAIE
jgi:hypothetical protein